MLVLEDAGGEPLQALLDALMQVVRDSRNATLWNVVPPCVIRL
jgi:hypothetical protein